MRLPALLLASAITLSACHDTYESFERNPDRDLSGVKSAPLYPADLTTLRRTAVVRDRFDVPIPAPQAVERITAGAQACWADTRRTDNAAFASSAMHELASGTQRRFVVQESWPNLNATVVGLGVEGKGSIGNTTLYGHIVMYAVVASSEGAATVYAYRREDDSMQRALVESARTWLSGGHACP